MISVTYKCSYCKKKNRKAVSNKEKMAVRKHRFCNQQCRNKWNEKQKGIEFSLTCFECGKKYKRHLNTVTKFCSKRCFIKNQKKVMSRTILNLKIKKEIIKDKNLKYITYFVRSKNLNKIKIGVTKNIYKKILFMESNNPDKLEVLCVIKGTGRNYDKVLQNKFIKRRYKNDWFFNHAEIISYIRKLK